MTEQSSLPTADPIPTGGLGLDLEHQQTVHSTRDFRRKAPLPGQ